MAVARSLPGVSAQLQSTLYYACEGKVSLLHSAGRQNIQHVPMQSASSPIPSICISPASPNKNHASPCPDDDTQVDDEAFRAKYLSPPPSVSPRHLSPLLSSTRANVAPKGLQREQFDLLLKASRERRAVLGVHRAPDLRKELAVKNQKNKQREYLDNRWHDHATDSTHKSSGGRDSCLNYRNHLLPQRQPLQRPPQSRRPYYTAFCRRRGSILPLQSLNPSQRTRATRLLARLARDGSSRSTFV